MWIISRYPQCSPKQRFMLPTFDVPFMLISTIKSLQYERNKQSKTNYRYYRPQSYTPIDTGGHHIRFAAIQLCEPHMGLFIPSVGCTVKQLAKLKQSVPSSADDYNYLTTTLCDIVLRHPWQMEGKAYQKRRLYTPLNIQFLLIINIHGSK